MQTEMQRMKIHDKKVNESLGFKLFRLIAKDPPLQNSFSQEHLEEIGCSGIHTESRQVCKKFLVPTGDYIIIPSMLKKDRPMKFFLRILQIENFYQTSREFIDELDSMIGFQNSIYTDVSSQKCEISSRYWREFDLI